MKQSLVAVTILLWLLLLMCMGTPAQAERITALTGGTVIDGTGAPPIPDGTVLIEGDRITAVGPSGKISIPAAAQVIDARGKWIIPGLIDAHIHFFQSGGLYTRPDIIDLRAERPYSQEMAWIRERIPQTLARYLASGVTSVVDSRALTTARRGHLRSRSEDQHGETSIRRAKSLFGVLLHNVGQRCWNASRRG
jgi:cytosine/adenosine deaminase-related metal-dependent hydrolase